MDTAEIRQGHGFEPATGKGNPYPKASWTGLKLDYITGKGTIANLARLHGINTETAWKRAGDERWTVQRGKWLDKQERALQALIDPETVSSAAPVTATGANPDPAGTVRGQIERIDSEIETETNPANLVKLVQAKTALFSLIHPKPGTARIKRNSTQARTMFVPVPVPDAGCVPALGTALTDPKAGPALEHGTPGIDQSAG